jgi:hypothetical protein
MVMGMRDVDIGDPTKVLRAPISDYNFGATVADEKVLHRAFNNPNAIVCSSALLAIVRLAIHMNLSAIYPCLISCYVELMKLSFHCFPEGLAKTSFRY